MTHKRYLFNLTKFEAVEINQSGLCIWCGSLNKKNKAHIFSKSLLKTNKAENYLKESVCVDCNSFFGNSIEDWFLKYSPISTWKTQYFTNNVEIKNLKFVPNFLWLENIQEWLVVNHAKVKDIFATQWILTADERLTFFHLDTTLKMSDNEINPIQDILKKSIIENNYTNYITKQLPEKFNPRIILHNNKVILLGRTEFEIKGLIEKVELLNLEKKESEIYRKPIGELGQLVINYLWSISKYVKWTSKIAFEFLSLFEGAEFCANENFASFKKQVIDTKLKDPTIKIPYYDGKGFAVKRLTAPGWLSYIDLDKKMNGFPVFDTPTTDCHKIFIYELNGYLLFTMSLFNVEYCQVVIAKNIGLQNIYYIEYDMRQDKLSFYVSNKSVRKEPTSKFNESLEYINSTPDMIFATFTTYEEIDNYFK